MKKLKKSRLIAALLLILSILTAAGCSGGTDDPGTSSGTGASSAPTGQSSVPDGGAEKVVTYAMGATWGSLVPYSYSSYYSNVVQSMIYDRLIRVNEEGGVEPRAAESWDISDDGKTYTFHLRKDAKWSDGTACTAADWVFAAEYITKESVTAPQKGYLSIVAGIDAKGNRESGAEFGFSAPDDYTLVITLDNPSFIESFMGTANAYILALPKHLLENMDAANWASDPFWSKPVTNGPFTFVSEVSGQELVLAASDTYYFPLDFDTLIFKVIASSNIPTSIMAGEVDLGYPYVTADVAQSLDGVDGVTVTKNTVDTSLMFLSVNTQKYPKEVRQAISLAIDKDLIVSQLILGEGETSSSFVNSSSEYYNPNVVAKRDLEKAKALLKEAGWDSNTVISFGVPSGIREKIAAIIQQNLAEIGVKTEITVMDTTTLFGNLRTGDTDCGLVTSTTTPKNPMALQGLFNPTAANFACIKEDTYMSLINSINAEQDMPKRIALVQEFAELVEDEAAYIPLYHEYTFVISSSRVTNATVIGTEAPWEWKVA